MPTIASGTREHLGGRWTSWLPKGPPRPMATCHRGSDPREVSLHFRGLRPADVSPYWLGEPDPRFVASDDSNTAPSGFPTDTPAALPKRCSSSHAVAPSSGFNPFGPPMSPVSREAGSNRRLSWSSAPLRRISPGESTPPRLATPSTFRPQGFSPSRRISPRPDAQSYFRPVTSMGFRSSGTFPRCQAP